MKLKSLFIMLGLCFATTNVHAMDENPSAPANNTALVCDHSKKQTHMRLYTNADQTSFYTTINDRWYLVALIDGKLTLLGDLPGKIEAVAIPAGLDVVAKLQAIRPKLREEANKVGLLSKIWALVFSIKLMPISMR